MAVRTCGGRKGNDVCLDFTWKWQTAIFDLYSVLIAKAKFVKGRMKMKEESIKKMNVELFIELEVRQQGMMRGECIN